MKKTISIILAALMLLSVFSITAMAKNGPNMEPDEYDICHALIKLEDTTKDGGEAFVFQNGITNNDAIQGATYDKDSNTLTLKDFKHPEICLYTVDMGDDFTLKIEGECELNQISMNTDDYGDSLSITGDGSLYVNPEKSQRVDDAVQFIADGAQCKLHVDDTVSVYFYGNEHAVYFQGCASMDADTVFTQGDKSVEIEKKREKDDLMVEAVYAGRGESEILGWRAHEATGRVDGVIYCISVADKDASGADIYNVDRYVMDNDLGTWVQDPDFATETLTEEEVDSKYIFETQTGTTPKYIEENYEGLDLKGYLIKDTNGNTYVIDIYFLENQDDMIHRAEPVMLDGTGHYVFDPTVPAALELNYDKFNDFRLTYVYEDEKVPFRTGRLTAGEFEVYENADGMRFIVDDDDNVYRLTEKTIIYNGRERTVAIPMPGTAKDNLIPVKVDGNNYYYIYGDEEYLYIAPAPATPDEQRTTAPATENSEPATVVEPTSVPAPEGTTAAVEPTSAPEGTTANVQPTGDDPQQPTGNVQPTNEQPTNAQPATEAKEPDVKEVKKGSSEKQVDKFVTSLKTEKDPKGSKFGLLCACQKKADKKSVSIKWNKLKGAKNYIVYGSLCGTKKGQVPPYKKITKTAKTSYTKKKLKKGTYFKFLIVALDKKGKVLASSKTVHIATSGGKVGNDKTVKLNKTKVSLKAKATFKLKAKEVPKSKKLKVKRHRKIKFESSDTKIAKVNSKGKITARKKGKATIYVYAQNGLYKTVKVTVK